MEWNRNQSKDECKVESNNTCTTLIHNSHDE